MLRLVILASGGGSLFQALIDAQEHMGAHIVALLADRDCGAIDRAQAAGIQTHIVALGDDRAEWDVALTDQIADFQPDLVVSAGFMKVLGIRTLQVFGGRIINTHPALLPQFPGAHAVRDALAAGATATGCTVHVVDEGVDTGPVIDQRSVEIRADDDEASLHERIRVVERELIVDVVSRFASGQLSLPWEV